MTLRERLLAGVVLPLLLLVPIWLTTPLIDHNQGLDEDGFHYAAMAWRHVAPPDRQAPPDLYRTAPWCWRVLTPFLVSFLPFELITGFKVLAFASNWVSLAALYGLLRRLRLSVGGCVLGVLLYAGIFWTVKFSFYSPTYVGFQTQMFVLVILYFMVAGEHRAIPPLLAVAVLQKETILFLIPVVAAYYWQRRRPFVARDWLWLVTVVLLPMAALVAVRTAVPALNRHSVAAVVVATVTGQLATLEFWPRFVVALFSGLGILPLVLGYRIVDAWRYLRRNPHWLVMLVCGGLLLLGGSDKARLLLPMTPAVVVLAAVVLDPLVRERKVVALAWLALTVLPHLYLGHHLTPLGSYAEYIDWLVPVHGSASVVPSLVRVAVVSAVWVVATVVLRGRWFREEVQVREEV